VLFPVLLLTPSIRPRRVRRYLFTYLIPLVPLVVLWDGLASDPRSRTVQELEELLEPLRSPEYHWEVGTVGLPARERGSPTSLGNRVQHLDSASCGPDLRATMESLGKTMLAVGLGVAVLGALLWLAGRFGFRGLPGDFRFGDENFRVYVPLGTSILISILLTLGLWLWGYLQRK
jgi:hypothetical protein